MRTLKDLITSEWLWLALLFVAAVDMIFVHLGLAALINPDEGRNASVALEMQGAGAWLIPTYNGLPYMDKPAFFFKAAALCMSLFGPTEFSARLPSALSALSLAALSFWFCRKTYDFRTAVIAILVIITCPLFFAFAHYVIFDMMLALFVSGAIFTGYAAEFGDVRYQKSMRILTPVFIGLAVLVKGPIGFVLPVLVLTVFFALERQKGAWKRLLSGRTWLILAAIILPWFIGASHFRPDFPYYGIVRESLARFTTHDFKRTGPVYFYIPVILGTFFPWSLLLPEAGWKLFRSQFTLVPADRLCIVWFLASVAFFSISQSKLPGYILATTIASGILTARLFAYAFDDPKASSIVRRAFILFLVLIAAAWSSTFYVHLHPNVLERHHFSDPDAKENVQVALNSFLILLPIPVLLGLLGLGLRDNRIILTVFLLPLLAAPMVFVPKYALVQDYRSDKGLAAAVQAQSDNNEVACLQCFPPGMPFYLGRPLTLITEKDGSEIKSNYIRFTLNNSSDWPANMVRYDQIGAWLGRRDKPVYLMAMSGRLDELKALAAPHHAVPTSLPQGYWGVLLPAAH